MEALSNLIGTLLGRERKLPAKLTFDSTTEIPNLTGKVILVTGGTAGLGRETVLRFADHHPAHIYFTGRSPSSAERLIEDVKTKNPDAQVTFISCDLSSLALVQKAAKELISKTDRLDIFMANAGVMALPPGLTKDGYEIQFGTNHVGQALLVKLLTPLMENTAKKTGDVRIVWLTSLGYRAHPKGGILFDKVKTPQEDIAPFAGEWMRYGQSKLANLLYARAYSEHHPSITSVSLHPGASATGLVNSLSFGQRMFIHLANFGIMITPEQCAWNQQWAATAPLGSGERQVETGKYYEPIGVKTVPKDEGTNDELAQNLYQWTEKELAGYSV